MNQYYSHHLGVKFIRVETSIGPAYVNIAAIASIRVSNVPNAEGKTEIHLINGQSYYVETPVDIIMQHVVSRIS